METSNNRKTASIGVVCFMVMLVGGCQNTEFVAETAEVSVDMNGHIPELPQEQLPLQPSVASSDQTLTEEEILSDSPLVQSLQSLWGAATPEEKAFFMQWLDQASE